MLKSGLFLLACGWFMYWESEVRAQPIRVRGQVQDYRSHQPLAGTVRWADSTGKVVREQVFPVDGFVSIVPGQARYLTLMSRGYRTVQLPVHWPDSPADSLSFRAIVPLVPVDKPIDNQPYFQSEQRPFHVPARATGPEKLVQFVISDALTSRPVRATLCLFPTKESKPRCYIVNTVRTKLVSPDIVAIEVRAPSYQPYFGNVVVSDSVDSPTLTVRLNPTPTVFMLAMPSGSKPTTLRLRSMNNGLVYPLTALDSAHFYVAAPPGSYRLTGEVAADKPFTEPIHLSEGITGYDRVEAPQMTHAASPDGVLYFAQSSYVLSDSAKQTLDQIALRLQQHPRQTVRITGHTDNMGDPQLNLTLSEFRAKVAKKYLQQQGIGDERIRLEAAGARQPTAPNDTEENRRYNRRVSLSIR